MGIDLRINTISPPASFSSISGDGRQETAVGCDEVDGGLEGLLLDELGANDCDGLLEGSNEREGKIEGVELGDWLGRNENVGISLGTSLGEELGASDMEGESEGAGDELGDCEAVGLEDGVALGKELGAFEKVPHPSSIWN